MVERQDRQLEQAQQAAPQQATPAQKQAAPPQTAPRTRPQPGARSEDGRFQPNGAERNESMAETAETTEGWLQGEMRDMTRRGAGMAAEAMRRDGEAAEEGMRQVADVAADRIRHFGETVAEASRDLAENTRLLMTAGNGSALQEWRHASTQLMERIVETNTRLVEELLRHAGPAHLFSLQQRFIREYLQTIGTGSRSLLQAAQHLAEQAAQPLERQERRHGADGRNRGTVADVMSRDVQAIQPDSTVKDIARVMTEADVGALPVQEGDQLIGMVTDRDIAVRLVAEGRDPSQTRVRDVMTPGIRYVFEDEDLEHVAGNMAEQHVRRLPVMNRQKRLVGMLSLDDLATYQIGELAGRALTGAAQADGHRAAAR